VHNSFPIDLFFTLSAYEEAVRLVLMKTPIFSGESAVQAKNKKLKECVKVVLKATENNSNKCNNNKIEN